MRILFAFFHPVHPTPPQAIVFPKAVSFWDHRTTLFSRGNQTCRGWVLGRGSERGGPTAKKGTSLKMAREKRSVYLQHLLMGRSLMGSFRKVLAEPRGTAKTLGNYSAKIVRTTFCHTNVRTTRLQLPIQNCVILATSTAPQTQELICGGE